MPGQVTVTRTITSTTTSAIIVNTGYCRTATGLLKLFQTIVGSVCLALIAYFGGFCGGKEETLFFLVTFGFLVTTFLLLVSCVISISSAAILPKSTFETLYHFVAFIFYLSASIALLIVLGNRNSDRMYYRERGYEGKMAAAALGLVNALLYIFSFVLSIRTFRIA